MNARENSMNAREKMTRQMPPTHQTGERYPITRLKGLAGLAGYGA
jgi:hypothetical protein